MADPLLNGDLCISSVVTNDLPVKKWRCTHGHQWESPVKIVFLSYEARDLGIPWREFCWFCADELFVRKLGQVKEVEP